MIDTHAHLDFPQFDEDRREAIKRFLDSGGQWLLNIGVNTERNQKTLELAEKWGKIYCALGYHPEELAEKSLEELLPEAEKFLLENGKNKKVRAIGEIGLDYFHNDKNKEDQKKLFIKQLEMAKILNLPVILHCRDAYEDVCDVISNFQFPISKQIQMSNFQNSKKEENTKIPARCLLADMAGRQKNTKIQNNKLKFVLHCYGGNLEQTERFLKLPNVYFSFTGNITFLKNKKSPLVPLLERGRTEDSELFEVIRKIPENRIMAETDCPFLAPNPFRGKRNEPSYVKMVIEKLAEIKGTGFEKMEKITDENAREFFGVK